MNQAVGRASAQPEDYTSEKARRLPPLRARLNAPVREDAPE